MKALDRWVPLAKVKSDAAEAVGTIAVALGIGAAVWGVIVFRRHKTTIQPHGAPTSLVTAGPYRFTRNPMYLGLTAVLAGIALDLGSLSPWLLVPVFVALITLGFIMPEERVLTERFGDAYAAYRARVRRWI